MLVSAPATISRVPSAKRILKAAVVRDTDVSLSLPGRLAVSPTNARPVLLTAEAYAHHGHFFKDVDSELCRGWG